MEATTVSVHGGAGRPARSRAAGVPVWIGRIALAGLLAGCLLVAIAAAQGRSPYLSPTVHAGAPSWLTWPFGGIWESRSARLGDIQRGLLAVFVAMHVCWAAAMWSADRLRARLVWAAVGAAYLVLFLSPPVLFTDLFNYIGYARLGVLHGSNPYTHLAASGPHDLAYALSTWHHLPNPYGPLFTLFVYPLAPLGVAGAYWVLKALVVGAGIASLVLVARIARRLERPPLAAVVLVGLNPIVLVYEVGGQHMDMLLLVPLLAAIELALSGRERASGTAAVLAAAVKASAAAALVVIVAGARERSRALAGALVAAVCVALATLVAFGPQLPDLSAQTRSVTPFSVPNVLGMALGRGGADAPLRSAMLVVFALAALACVAWAWRRRTFLEPLGWLTVATLATLSWDMAWYIVWLLPFVAFVPARRFRIAAVAMCAWMTIQWLPMFPNAMHAIGFNPSRTATWHANSLYEKRLVR